MRTTLAKLRVLDFCWVGAGALVTKLLAEHGAEVIKVESQARPDNLRVAPPYRPGTEGIDASGYFASRNNDKKSLALNMNRAESRKLALRLATNCDVVANNFRPGVMERWGLGYDKVSGLNPRVVYLSMPMQGSGGPHDHFIGFGSTIAALAGLVHLSGRPDRAPVGTGTHYPDHIPSPGHALVALLAAIRQVNRTGRGRLVELSQLESMVSILGSTLAAVSAGRDEPERSGNRVAGHCPSGAFRCAGDESWIALAARNDSEWVALASELEIDCERFSTLARRRELESDLELIIAERVAPRGRAELAAALQARGVPAWPVLSSRDLLSDPQLHAREFWRDLDHPVIGSTTVPAAPYVADGQRVGPVEAAPLLGEHTADIATSLLGMTDHEVDGLVRDRVLW